MYLRELLASLRRRWYLLIVAVLATGLVCFGVSRLIGPTYEAEGAVVLVPPPDPVDPHANPFISLGSLKQAGDIMIRSLSSDATHRKVLTAAPEGDYTVAPDYSTSAPVLVIKAAAPTPAQASKMLKVALARVPTNLASLQNGLSIDSKNQIASEVIDLNERPSLVIKAQLRAVVGAGVAVLGVLCLLIGAVDAAMRRRRAVRARIRAVASTQHGGAGEPTPIPVDSRGNRRREAGQRR